ncbi:MAG: signal peptidase I [Cellulosilyticaceae bacterium]
MKKIKKQLGWLGMVWDMGVILLIVLLLNQFFVTNTVVPSASMEPTIMTGDRTLVSPIPYYYKDPARGDIAIFKEGEELMVKRVIGLPGETIMIEDGGVYIDGNKLDESAYLDPSVETLYEEMPYEVKEVLPYTIPEDYYFMMGDNRMYSMDSRYFGAISREAIRAQGSFRFYPFNKIGIIK